jgi:hypothetical protein
MRKNPLNKGIIMEKADGIGTVTPAMVEARARELARINGRETSSRLLAAVVKPPILRKRNAVQP